LYAEIAVGLVSSADWIKAVKMRICLWNAPRMVEIRPYIKRQILAPIIYS